MCKIKKPKQKVWHEILEEPIGGSTKRRWMEAMNQISVCKSALFWDVMLE
jgi:hypothetical protein